MSVHLLDINVLVSLLWTNHDQHDAANRWFRRNQRHGWATCPMTQTGFVRVSSNPRVFPVAPTPGKAAEILERNLAHATHRFFADDLPFSRAIAPFADLLLGHQQTTDAYLFGLAVHHKAVLATFDGGIAALAGDDPGLERSLVILDV
jgi:toxin-antitoxin system PIN domain toxin